MGHSFKHRHTHTLEWRLIFLCVVESVINHVLRDQAASVFNFANSPYRFSRTRKVCSESSLTASVQKLACDPGSLCMEFFILFICRIINTPSKVKLLRMANNAKVHNDNKKNHMRQCHNKSRISRYSTKHNTLMPELEVKLLLLLLNIFTYSISARKFAIWFMKEAKEIVGFTHNCFLIHR